jgi:hypothetical protein
VDIGNVVFLREAEVFVNVIENGNCIGHVSISEKVKITTPTIQFPIEKLAAWSGVF